MGAPRRSWRPPKHSDLVTAGASNTCGKIAFASRVDARRFAKRQHPSEHMRAYHCPTCDLWHNGHNPMPVMLGHTTAREHYQRRRQQAGQAA